MKKILTAVILLTVLCALTAFSQQWQFVKAFPDTNIKGPSGCHGIAVDPDGKVWIQIYGIATGDSIKDATSGLMRGVRTLKVYNRDGTPAAISGIKTITIGTTTDTLYSANVGLRKDHTGNILVANYHNLFRVNYKTGAGMNKVIPVPTKTVVAPGVTTAGEIFVGTVIPPSPIFIYDANFAPLGNAVDTSVGFARSMNVSPDGNDVYWTAFSLGALWKYHSDFGTLGPYIMTDTLLKGMAIESSCWNPKSGLLYLSSGGQTPSLPPYANKRWYGWNPTTKQIVDTLVWDSNTSPDVGAFDCRPRAIAFSPGGDTAYVGAFNTSVACVQMFRRGAASVRQDRDLVPEGFTLAQNYPNPFNPTTEIKFTLVQSGLTTLVVYDMLGREVETLVNENMTQGAYTVSFDASKLPSGTYLYRLASGGNSITKKMLLVK